MNERIVCAANKMKEVGYNTLFYIYGVRHYGPEMREALEMWEDRPYEEIEQGFLTNKRGFVSRQEAWKIAVAAGQIIRRVGGDTSKGGTLYSENLY